MTARDDKQLPLPMRIQRILDTNPLAEWAAVTTWKTKECVLLIAQEVDEIKSRLDKLEQTK